MRTYREQRNVKKINEALENDITWGDSWAGRIFSSIFRNAKLVADLKIAIPNLLKDLDKAINNTVIEEISKDDDVADAIKKVKSAGIKDTIIEEVKTNPSNLEKTLKKMTDEHGEEKMENIINSFPDEMQEILAELIAHVNDEHKKSKDNGDSIYPTIVRNLKALKAIVGDDLQIDVDPGQNRPSSDPKNGTRNNNPEHRNANQNQAAHQNQNQNGGRVINFAEYNKNDNNDNQQKPAVNEKVTVDKNNTDVITAHQKLVKAINALKNQSDKGISVDPRLLGNFIDNALNSDSKNTLKKLYGEIYKYVSGEKTGIGEIDPLINEKIEFLESNNNLVIIAEKIARFYKRSIQFEKLNLYGPLGDLGKALKAFNESMSKIMKFEADKNKEVTELPEEPIQESFLSNLFSKDKSNNKVRVSGFGNKVTIIYNGKEFNTVEEMDKLAKENNDAVTEKVSSVNLDDKKVNEIIERSSIDVIEIVRIFNKANKLMVRNTIPSFRTNGKINSTRANNWTKLDGGGIDPNNPGAGPFRNNKLHHAWNDGVLAIMKDNEEVLKASRLVDDNGKIVKAKYPISKFMTDMLDDSKMFIKGNQSKYLHQYFGIAYNDVHETSKLPTPGKVEKKKEDSSDAQDTTDVKPVAAGGDYTWNRALGKFKERAIYKATIKGSTEGKPINNVFYLVGIGEYDGYILYKMSQSDEIVKKYSEGYEVTRKESKISHIFFKEDSDTKTRKFEITKRVMSTNIQPRVMDESNVQEIVLNSINDVRVLKEKDIEVTSYKTDYEARGAGGRSDESYSDKYCLDLKRILVDDVPTNEAVIQLFKDFINSTKI